MGIDPISLGITLALTAASMALQMSATIEGPRLDDLAVNTGDYGAPLPRIWGDCRIDCPPIYAQNLREVHTEQKTKGGKYQNYSYFGTWAVAIGETIQSVDKIRFDAYLVYDATGAGPISPFQFTDAPQGKGDGGGDGGGGILDYIHIYLGTDTQPVNAAMQADIEAQFGAGYCPAFRDTSYIVFVDVPLDKLGNRLPQVSCEVNRSNGQGVAGLESVLGGSDFGYSQRGMWNGQGMFPLDSTQQYTGMSNEFFGTNNTIVVLDNETHTLAGSNSGENILPGPSDFTGRVVDKSGNVWGVGTGVHDDEIWKVPDFGGGTPELVYTFGGFPTDTSLNAKMYIFTLGDDTEVLVSIHAAVRRTNGIVIRLIDTTTYDVTAYDSSTSPEGEISVHDAFLDDYGDVWIVAADVDLYAASSTCYLWRLTDTNSSPYGVSGQITGLPTVPAGVPGSYYTPVYLGAFFHEGKIYIEAAGPSSLYIGSLVENIIRVDPITLVNENVAPIAEPFYYPGSINYPATLTYPDFEQIWRFQATTSSDYSSNPGENVLFRVDPDTGEILEQYDPHFWQYVYTDNLDTPPAQFTIGVHQYTELGGIPTFIGGGYWNGSGAEGWHYSWLRPGSAYPVTLADIGADLFDWAGVQSYNVSAWNLIQVRGWFATRGTIVAMLDPLLTMYDCSVRQNGFTLEGIVRTGEVWDSLNASQDFIEQTPLFSAPMVQPVELPKSVVVTYTDMTMDKQPNTSRAARGYATTEAEEERTISMSTWTSTPDEAQQLTNRAFRRIWNSDINPKFRLSNAAFDLLPGDVMALNMRGEQMDACFTRTTIDFGNDYMDVDSVSDSESLHQLDGTTVGAQFLGDTPDTVYAPIDSDGYIFDIPYVQDADANVAPVLYFATNGNTDEGSWPGATFFRYFEGLYNTPEDTFAPSQGAAHGNTDGVLGEADEGFWDRKNNLIIEMIRGSLVGTTEAMCEETITHNMAAVGAPGRWELIQFTRAQLVGPGFYELSNLRRGLRGTEAAITLHENNDAFVFMSQAQWESFGLDTVGTNLSFKAISMGMDGSGSSANDVTPFTGASLKPLSVVDVTAVWESDDDIALAWERRSRVGASWRDGVTPSLSEATEEYSIDVMDGTDVVNTYTSTSQNWTYSAADQVTDWGSVQTSVTVRIYQISAAVGRGFVKEMLLAA